MYSWNKNTIYTYSFYCLLFFILSVKKLIAFSTSEEINVHLTAEPEEIALSLDDAPMPGTAIFSGRNKTKKIIEALKEKNCPPIGIFAVGEYTQVGNNMERLRMYGEAGHIIANHSYSHHKLNNVTTQDFIADIKRAHDVLSSLPNFKPLFRFPYLCEGKNEKQRQEVIEFLQQMGYKEGYITINNHDYYINKLLVEAVKAEKIINYTKLKDLYIRILWDCITTNQKLAHNVLQRKVKHVLLLHENDLAALFIGDLIDYIRKQGWKLISIEEAYTDPIAAIKLTNITSGGGRINAIAVEKKMDRRFVTFPETVYLNYIPKALKQQKIFTDRASKL